MAVILFLFSYFLVTAISINSFYYDKERKLTTSDPRFSFKREGILGSSEGCFPFFMLWNQFLFLFFFEKKRLQKRNCRRSTETLLTTPFSQTLSCSFSPADNNKETERIDPLVERKCLSIENVCQRVCPACWRVLSVNRLLLKSYSVCG